MYLAQLILQILHVHDNKHQSKYSKTQKQINHTQCWITHCILLGNCMHRIEIQTPISMTQQTSNWHNKCNKKFNTKFSNLTTFELFEWSLWISSTTTSSKFSLFSLFFLENAAYMVTHQQVRIIQDLIIHVQYIHQWMETTIQHTIQTMGTVVKESIQIKSLAIQIVSHNRISLGAICQYSRIQHHRMHRNHNSHCIRIQ